jgi:predicted O-methyltransferase YrrM
MNEEVWTAVDEYLAERLIPADPVLTAAHEANVAAELPAIDVSPTQGKLLHLLARLQGAKRILEIGTLGGYSTIWLARALPEDGRLVTLELEEKHAAVAKKNVERAGLSQRVELRLGPAAQSLEALHREGVAAFDFIFIDADKPNNPVYLEWALKLARVGTVLVVDNVIREGAVIDAESTDASVKGTRRLFDLMAANPRLDATALQTVGSKGYDGFVVAIVRS